MGSLTPLCGVNSGSSFTFISFRKGCRH